MIRRLVQFICFFMLATLSFAQAPTDDIRPRGEKDDGTFATSVTKISTIVTDIDGKLNNTTDTLEGSLTLDNDLNTTGGIRAVGTPLPTGVLDPFFHDFNPTLPFTVRLNPSAMFYNTTGSEAPGAEFHGYGLSSNSGGASLASYPNALPFLGLFAGRGTYSSQTILSTNDAVGGIGFFANGIEDGVGGYVPGYDFPSGIIVATVDALVGGPSALPIGRPVTIELSSLAGAQINIENDGSFGTLTEDDKVAISGWFDVSGYSTLDSGAEIGTVSTLIGVESETSLLSGGDNILILPSGATGVFTESSGTRSDRILIGQNLEPAAAAGVGAVNDSIAIGNGAVFNRNSIYIGREGSPGASDIGDETIAIGQSIAMPGDDSIGIGQFFSGTGLEGDHNLAIGQIVSSNAAARNNTAWLGSAASTQAYTLFNLNGGDADRAVGFATRLQTGGIAFSTAAANSPAGSFTINVGKSSGNATSPLLLNAWLPTTSGQNEQTTVGASLILEGGNAAINDDKSNDISLRVGAFEDEKTILELTQDETDTDRPQIRTRIEQRNVNTTDATSTTLWDSDTPAIGLPSAIVYVKAKIMAQSWAGGQAGSTIGDVAFFEVSAAFKIDGAANTRIGAVQTDFNEEDAGLAAVAVDVDVTGVTGPIEIEVTGLAGEDIIWSGEIEYTFSPLNPEV